MTADCGPTQTPTNVDIDALREKYRVEREKRLRPEGSAQYLELEGDYADFYEVDPYTTLFRSQHGQPALPAVEVHGHRRTPRARKGERSMTADCGPTQTPTDIDIDAMREKYRVEREKRLRPEGSAQYLELEEIGRAHV